MIGKLRRFFRVLFPLFCLAVLLIQCIKIREDFREYRQAEEEYERWADDTKEKEDGGTSIDFESLQKRNPDIVAWIHIPDTTIDYPVVQGSDNAYYLNHTAAGQENSSGAIFLDAGCDTAFSGDNYIIYGHNMRTKKMFGCLKELYDPYYNKDASILVHPDIVIDRPGEEIRYRVFSVRRIHLKKQKGVYVIRFLNDETKRNYVQEARSESLLTGETFFYP
ncbi:MAG: class B sortase, partial [Eubacterium sp.]|nr:class B sortase [Eubacterium sp.]